jgi:putative chitinase
MIDRTIFFASVRPAFAPNGLDAVQVKFLNAMLNVWDALGFTDLRWLAYALATNWHECRFRPVREGDTTGQGITDAQAYARVSAYCRKHGKRNYAARDPKTGISYYGRGGPQLTHKGGYANAGRRVGLDLVNNPDLMLDPAVCAQVTLRCMVAGDFTGVRLLDVFNATRNDPERARRIVNGLDKALLIAGYHETFLHIVRRASVGHGSGVTDAASVPVKAQAPAAKPGEAKVVAADNGQNAPAASAGAANGNAGKPENGDIGVATGSAVVVGAGAGVAAFAGIDVWLIAFIAGAVIAGLIIAWLVLKFMKGKA